MAEARNARAFSSPEPDSVEDRSLEDARLVTEILTGDDREGACEELVRKYWKALVSWIHVRVRSVPDAEEIAQDTLAKAFRSLEKIESPRCFAAWMFRIAGNTTTDFLRKRRRTVSLDALTGDWNDADESLDRRHVPHTLVHEPERALEREESIVAALDAVGKLADKYRVVITLRYCMGMSAKDIATRLGEPEGTIRNRVFRAVAMLRSMLGEDEKSAVGDERDVTSARQGQEQQP